MSSDMTKLSIWNLEIAIRDLIQGLFAYHVWHTLAWSELRQRYRRSTFGPFWLTLSMAVTVTVMSIVVGLLFQMRVEKVLPYIACNLIFWNFLSGTINESAMGFISASQSILQVKRPVFIYIMKILWSNCLILLHVSLVFIVLAVIFQIWPGWMLLLLPLGLFIMALNISWIGLACAILSTRFRDLPMMIQNSFTLLFWLTPIIYMPEQLSGNGAMLVQLNPLTHIFEVARAPLLGESFSILSWSLAAGTALLGWAATLVLFARARARIPYWL